MHTFCKTLLPWLIRFLFGSLCLLLLAWLLGTFLRDRVWGPFWLTLYYIPAPVAALAGFVWLACFRRRAVWLVAVMGGVTVAASLKVLTDDMRWAPVEPGGDASIRVVHWNMARGKFGDDTVWEMLRADRPDLCVLSESSSVASDPGRREEIIPGAQHLVLHGMTVLSRYPMQLSRPLRHQGVNGGSVRVDTPHGQFEVMVVDVAAHPWLKRGPPMRALREWVDERDRSVPLLVVGDFNTPRDSVHLALLREELRHAYEIGGRGLPYSYPMPVPLYAIDHAWVSPDIRVSSYRLRRSRGSDHLRQVMELELPDDDLTRDEF